MSIPRRTKSIASIEKPQALEHLGETISEANLIMVARAGIKS